MYKLFRFPDWKEKAMTLSYDDGVIYDEQLVRIMQKYGLKGTFNLNAGLFGRTDYRRMDENTCVKLFQNSGMEVAMHGMEHLMVTACDGAGIVGEFYQDKMNLERIFGTVMRGGAYAYGRYNDETIRVLQTLGVDYFRTTVSTHAFDIPSDWLRLNPTCHHKENIMELFQKFVQESSPNMLYRTPKLFYLWGHSYEFNDNNNWGIIEEFGAKVAEYDDIWHATNSEVYDYVKAYKNLIFSAKGDMILNKSNIDVYLCVNGKNVLAKAGQITKLIV